MIQKFPLYFNPGREDRTIHLYLPDNYYDSDERYPVVYMFDGHNLFYDSDATYGKSWGMKEYLDGWWKHVIIVGLECSHHGNERLSEFGPYDFKERSIGRIVGRGEETMQWIRKTLKPYIDAHYRTWPHREATAVAGSSMGGAMALYAVLRHNDIFSKSASISPAFFASLPAYIKLLRTNRIDPDTRLFISWGTEEDPRGWLAGRIAKMDAAARAAGITTCVFRQEGGHHCEADWERQLPLWLPFLWE